MFIMVQNLPDFAPPAIIASLTTRYCAKTINGMTETNQIYQCHVCGNVVEIIQDGVGSLICCNQPMHLLPEKTEDEGLEKHVPIIEKTDKGAKVRVGSIIHPMERKHFIRWIELAVDGQKIRQYLSPDIKPEVEFEIQSELPKNSKPVLKALSFCNRHGLWKNKDH